MSESLTYCACGDGYPKTSYGAGFIDGRGRCENCHAAELAAVTSHGKERAEDQRSSLIYAGAPSTPLSEPTWWEIQHKNGRRWATDDKEEAESISQFLTVSPLYTAPIEPKTYAKPVAWRIKNKRFCGDVTLDEEVANHWIANGNSGDVTPLYANPIENPSPFTLPRVHGDLLPPVGSKVLIYLNSHHDWVEHTVAGYYVWGDLKHDPSLQRVFIQVIDGNGYYNARLLREVKTPDGELIIKLAPPTVEADHLGDIASFFSSLDC